VNGFVNNWKMKISITFCGSQYKIKEDSNLRNNAYTLSISKRRGRKVI